MRTNKTKAKLQQGEMVFAAVGIAPSALRPRSVLGGDKIGSRRVSRICSASLISS